MSKSDHVTTLLRRATAGDPEAAAEIVPLIYGELRRLASHYMAAERRDHVLQTTALVHEAYLRLVDPRQADWRSRTHFYGAAAQVMRRILVDHARARHAAKRGNDPSHLPLAESLAYCGDQPQELVELDEALTRLAKLNARQAKVIELRFFAGLGVDETAEVLGVSPKTVKRDWCVARAWLRRELRGLAGA